jgi:hypothetical protein
MTLSGQGAILIITGIGLGLAGALTLTRFIKLFCLV